MMTTKIIVRISTTEDLRGLAEVEQYVGAMWDRLVQGEGWEDIKDIETLGFMSSTASPKNDDGNPRSPA